MFHLERVLQLLLKCALAKEIGYFSKNSPTVLNEEVKKVRSKVFCRVFEEDVRAIVFGSVVRGDFTLLSDLDVLVISKKAEEVDYGKVLGKIEEEFGNLLGIEIHLVTPEVFERWYKKFLDVYEEFNAK